MPFEATDPLFAPYFAGLAAGELRFPRCDGCGRFHWYPKACCPWCGGTDVTWVPAGPDGTLFSWTTVRHAFAPEFRERLPYTIGLVEPAGAPGVRLVTRVVLPAGVEPRCGLPIRALVPTDPDEEQLVKAVAAGVG